MDRPFPAYQGDDPYVFVSYAHEDDAIVYPELQRLRDRGFNVWYDEGISPGASWRQEIADFIDGASLFLYLVTPRSIVSGHCQKEVSFATEHDKPLIAVHLEQTDLPTGMELTLSDIQAILKYELNEQDYDTKLVSGVGAHLGASAVPTAPPPQRSNNNRRLIVTGFGLVILAILGVGVLLYGKLTPETSEAVPVAESDVTSISTIPAVADAKPSIAVLPFDNLSPLEENAYFAAGVHEDILSNLAKVADLKVISHTSVMRFKNSQKSLQEIANELGVGHILEGRVRRAGNQVRITVRLIDAAEDQQLWAETYDRDLADIFAVQSEVAKNITEQLKVTLEVNTLTKIKAGPTKNMDAYILYLRARDLVRTGSSSAAEKAMELFQQALAADPEFALAHAGIAEVYEWQSGINVEWQQVKDKALAAASRALELDPASSETHLMMGRVYMMERRYDEAEQELKEAVRLGPNNEWAVGVYGGLLMQQGHFEEGFEYWRRALEISPMSPNANFANATIQRTLGRIDEAEQYLLRGVELRPAASSYQRAAFFYTSLGDHYKGLSYVGQAYELDPRDISYPLNLSARLQALGDIESSEKWLAIASQISPQHDAVYGRRIVILTATERHEERAQLIDEWLEYNPESQGALAQKAILLGRDASVAWEDEEFGKARELREQTLAEWGRILDPFMEDGVLQIRANNLLAAMAYAANARILGYNEVATTVCKDVIDFLNTDNQMDVGGHLLLTIAYALTGNITLALDRFEQAEKGGFNALGDLDAWGLNNDQYGIFNGLSANIAYQQIRDRIQRRNEETLARVRQDMPRLVFAAPYLEELQRVQNQP